MTYQQRAAADWSAVATWAANHGIAAAADQVAAARTYADAVRGDGAYGAMMAAFADAVATADRAYSSDVAQHAAAATARYVALSVTYRGE